MFVTAFAFLFPPILLFRALRSGFYMLHIVLVMGVIGVMEQQFMVKIAGPAAFSEKAMVIVLMLHLASINLVAFLAYGYDKIRAKRGGWRVPERTLHSFGMLGGVIGAFVAQKLFRHKTRKRSFQAVFWVIFSIMSLVAILLGIRFL